MKIHYLQHVPFEDLANIEYWAIDKCHELSRTHLFENEELPPIGSFDWLIIMGGPMNIYEHDRYPWLIREKKFISEAIANDKVALGICLGAQLLADVLGGKVSKNEQKEVGWHTVRLTSAAKSSQIFRVLPERFMAFHWHGDTFSIPPRAKRMAESEACLNQAFEIDKAIGIQFHLESSIDSIDHLILNCAEELSDGRYVQKSEELLSHLDRLSEISSLMRIFLDNIEKVLGNSSKDAT